MSISSALVIGSGTMGQGIAQVAATAGLVTHVYDANAAQIWKAQGGIEKSLAKLVEKGKVAQDRATAARSNLKIEQSLDAIDGLRLDIVIEAIFESFDAKTALYREIGKRLRP